MKKKYLAPLLMLMMSLSLLPTNVLANKLEGPTLAQLHL